MIALEPQVETYSETETFTFPSSREARIKELIKEGWIEAPYDGRPIQTGQFRKLDRLGKFYLRLGAPPSPEAPNARFRWAKHRARVAALQPRVLQLASEGLSVSAIMAETGISREAVKKLIGDRVFHCPCGKLASHKGPCAERFEMTPAREEAARKRAEKAMTKEGRLEARERARKMQGQLSRQERSAKGRAAQAKMTTAKRTLGFRKRMARTARARQKADELLSEVSRGTIALDSPGLKVELQYSSHIPTLLEKKLLRRLAEALIRFDGRGGASVQIHKEGRA